ncbi:MAG TPA: SigB/SigF/SigG family RNA polymerase sigma factor [Cryptosporangiaceae bacterium]|nr:SigB/SigF/SigG family RNA polymerase sigma factor [Cryptosporangiaceae bacterium]
MIRPDGVRCGHGRLERLDYSDYRSVAPLFEALARLPAEHPERAGVREQLVRAHLPLVRNIAQKFASSGEPRADLTQVGVVGLLHAIDRFDPGRGLPFLGFAIPTVTGAVRQHLRETGWALHVPRRLKDLHARIVASIPPLSQRHRRAPTATEIAAHLGVEREEVVRGLAAGNAYGCVPLETAVAGETAGAGQVASLGVPDAGLSLVEDRAALKPLLARLPPREQRILRLRFFDRRTQTEIAAELGTSQVQISRALARALETLRRGLLEDA